MAEYVDPAPVVTYAAPARVIEYVSSALVIEYLAPAPAMTYVASSQQLPPAHTMTTDTTDNNFDITDLVNTQFSSTAVETFVPQVIVSNPPFEEFSGPVYKQVHQEQTAACETTENNAEIHVVQEQMLVQEIPHAPQVVDSSPPLEDFCRAAECSFSRIFRGSGCGVNTGTNCRGHRCDSTGFTDDPQYELHVDQQFRSCVQPNLQLELHVDQHRQS